MPSAWIRIGTVRTVNPARRELHVRAEPVHAHQFDGLAWAGIGVGDEPVLRCRVDSLTRRAEEVTIRLNAGVTRDAVATMRYAAVLMEEAARTPRPDGDWHSRELAGLTVVGPEGMVLGTVREIIEAPGNDVMDIEKPSGGSVLLPVIMDVIESVDLEAGRIHVGDIAPYAVDDED